MYVSVELPAGASTGAGADVRSSRGVDIAGGGATGGGALVASDGSLPYLFARITMITMVSMTPTANPMAYFQFWSDIGSSIWSDVGSSISPIILI